MPRAPRDYRLDTRDVRKKLKARKEPYWRQVVPGTFLGYYKGPRGGVWVVRQRDGDGYRHARMGIADDLADGDGDVVLSYTQAALKVPQVKLAERKPEAPRHYADGLTLNKVFDEYLKDRKVTPGGRFNRVMPASTADNMAGTWKLYTREDIGAKLVTALDAKALRKWQAGIVKRPPTNRGKVMPFDPADPEQLRSRWATANKQLTSVKAALNWARKTELLPDNLPDFWRIVAPFNLGDEGEPRMLDTDEVRRLLNAAGPDLRDLLSGALMTGARLGEVRAMKVADYDPDTATVRIYQSKTYKTLRQPLTPEGVKLFDRLTDGRPLAEKVFTRADGSEWGPSDHTKPVRAAMKAASVDDASFKTMRATYGKLLLIATKDIEMVAKALGHSDSRITRKHYARYLPNEVAAAVAKLPKLGIGGSDKVSRISRARA